MKICLINNLYKPFNRGGSERVVEIIAKELQKQKHQAFIISTKPLYFGQSQKNQTQTNYYLSSLFFYLEKIPLVLKFFWHIWNIFNFINYFKIKKILKKEKPDIVMTHNLMGVGFLIPKLIQKLKIKHYHTLHDIQLLYPTGLMLCGREKKINQIHSRIYAKICAWLFSSPTKIIAPSQWLLNLHDKKNFFKHAKK